MDTSTPHSGRFTARAVPSATRVLAAAAVAGSVAYLCWRATTLGAASRWPLSVPLFLIETWAAAGFALFVAAGWRRPEVDPPASAASGSFPRVQIFVDARGAAPGAVERTLVGVASLRGAGPVTVLVDDEDADHGQMSDALAHRTESLDGRPVVAAVAGADSPLAMWLDAGQITMPDALEAAVARFDDAAVATCQVAVGWLSANSLARLRGGRDQDALMRRIIGPSLSERGAAPWDGAGSIVRTQALRDAIDTIPHVETTGQVRGLLLSGGWHTTYDPRELIRGVAPETLADYLADRHARTAATWRGARRRGGALRRGGGGFAARLAPLFQLVAASAGLRLLSVAMLTCAAVIAGRLPFDQSAATIAGPWLGLMLVVSLTRRLIAGDTMAMGDWTRQAWRTLPADASAFFGTRMRDREPGETRGGLAALGILWPLSLMILALDAAILLRGLTLLAPDALPRFGATDRVLVLLWALALLVPLGDVVLGAARRRQRRSAPRLETSLPITLGDTATRTIDISPSGIGLLTDAAPAVGSVAGFQLTLPTLDGRTERITGSATVRSANADPSGRVRVGLEFLNLSPDARAALIGYCGVGHAIEFVDRTPTPIEPAQLEVEGSAGRRPVGGITTAAVVAGMAVVLAGPSAGVAAADDAVPLEQVCVVTADDAPVAGAAVSRISTNGEELLGATAAEGCISVAPDADASSYIAAAGGMSARADVDDAAGGVLTITLSGRSVAVVDTAGNPVRVELRIFAEAWSEPIRIDGTTTLPPDAAIEAIEVRWSDTTHVVPVDGDVVVVLARLVADEGASIVEVDRGAGWEAFVDGMEVLPGRLAVRLDDGTVVKLDVPGDHEMQIPSGAISRLDLAQNLAPPPSASGQPAATPLAGATEPATSGATAPTTTPTTDATTPTVTEAPTTDATTPTVTEAPTTDATEPTPPPTVTDEPSPAARPTAEPAPTATPTEDARPTVDATIATPAGGGDS